MAALNEQWRKASYSNNGASCVEVRYLDGVVQVRDTKLGETSPVLSFTPDEWRALTDGVRAGEFDLT